MKSSLIATGVLAVLLTSCQVMPRYTWLPKDRYPVHTAACRGDTNALEELLRANRANALIRNGDGNTPLHLAALHGRAGAIRCLVSAGADLNARNNAGATPLMFAAKGGDLDSVKLLLESGANPKMKHEKNSTAIDWAKRDRHYGIAARIAVAAARTR